MKIRYCKSWVCLLLVLSLVLSMAPAMAAATPSISVSSGQATPGGEVTLTVSLADNPGIAACMVYLYYDTSVFTVDLDSGITSAGNFTSGLLAGNSIAIADKNGRYNGDPNQDGAMVGWFDLSGIDKTSNGDFFQIKLKIAANAPAGEYPIVLDYDKDNTLNFAMNEVAFSTGSSTVTVTGGTSNPGTADPGTSTPGTSDPGADPGTTPGTTDPGTTTPVQPEGPVPTEPSIPGATVNPFQDVSGHWAQEFILEAASRELVQGAFGLYRPDDTMTRADFVTVIWRAMGKPAATKAATYSDLTQDWYRESVAWAEENKIVNGVGKGKFAPNSPMTREMVVTILHRLAGTPMGMEVMFGSVYDDTYSDSAKISSWAKDALYWSIFREIYCGEASLSVGLELAPGAPANRAQLAVMIVRYLDKMA